MLTNEVQTIMNWKVYILNCADNTLYTGITTDVKRRVNEHNNNNKGARYTRARRPVTLVYEECYESRADASRREYHIKQLNRIEKLKLIQSGSPS